MCLACCAQLGDGFVAIHNIVVLEGSEATAKTATAWKTVAQHGVYKGSTQFAAAIELCQIIPVPQGRLQAA